MIPKYIHHAVRSVLSADPQFATAAGAVDCCVMASQSLVEKIKELNADAQPKIVGDHYHAWVLVNDLNIDLTAKQFDAAAPCPKIWKSNL